MFKYEAAMACGLFLTSPIPSKAIMMSSTIANLAMVVSLILFGCAKSEGNCSPFIEPEEICTPTMKKMKRGDVRK